MNDMMAPLITALIFSVIYGLLMCRIDVEKIEPEENKKGDKTKMHFVIVQNGFHGFFYRSTNQIFFPDDVVEHLDTGKKGVVEFLEIFKTREGDRILRYRLQRSLTDEPAELFYIPEVLVLYKRPAYNDERFQIFIRTTEYKQEWMK